MKLLPRTDVVDAIEAQRRFSLGHMVSEKDRFMVHVISDAILAAINALPASNAWRDIAEAPSAGSLYLFVAYDDDGNGHLTWCASACDVHAAVRTAVFACDESELTIDNISEVAGITGELLESGHFSFEGDPPLALIKLPSVPPTPANVEGDGR